MPLSKAVFEGCAFSVLSTHHVVLVFEVKKPHSLSPRATVAVDSFGAILCKRNTIFEMREKTIMGTLVEKAYRQATS